MVSAGGVVVVVVGVVVVGDAVVQPTTITDSRSKRNIEPPGGEAAVPARRRQGAARAGPPTTTPALLALHASSRRGPPRLWCRRAASPAHVAGDVVGGHNGAPGVHQAAPPKRGAALVGPAVRRRRRPIHRTPQRETLTSSGTRTWKGSAAGGQPKVAAVDVSSDDDHCDDGANDRVASGRDDDGSRDKDRSASHLSAGCKIS